MSFSDDFVSLYKDISGLCKCGRKKDNPLDIDCWLCKEKSVMMTGEEREQDSRAAEIRELFEQGSSGR